MQKCYKQLIYQWQKLLQFVGQDQTMMNYWSLLEGKFDKIRLEWLEWSFQSVSFFQIYKKSADKSDKKMHFYLLLIKHLYLLVCVLGQSNKSCYSAMYLIRTNFGEALFSRFLKNHEIKGSWKKGTRKFNTRNLVHLYNCITIVITDWMGS